MIHLEHVLLYFDTDFYMHIYINIIGPPIFDPPIFDPPNKGETPLSDRMILRCCESFIPILPCTFEDLHGATAVSRERKWRAQIEILRVLGGKGIASFAKTEVPKNHCGVLQLWCTKHPKG